MEKKVRYAAKRMFGVINKAHKDVLSKEEYLEAIKEITGDKHTRKLLAAAGKFKYRNILNFFLVIFKHLILQSA